ncbi:cytochrome P450 [Luminiphilus sp.]|nr:cytochrome P450 [Luminiphilus sp.]
MSYDVDPNRCSIDQIDVSDSRLYQSDTWQPYFSRLRQEDPVHFSSNDLFGDFWSVTKFEDIVSVDTDHHTFSSEPAITIGDYGDDVPVRQFIAMDPPHHTPQRATVQPVVEPKQLSSLEPLIRQRVSAMLDELPLNEPFDWVQNVSINLTTQMLATLFDFPFDEREKLTYWSDMAGAIPEIAGGDAVIEERNEAMTACLTTFTELWHLRKNNKSSNHDFITMLANDARTTNMIDDPMLYLGNMLLLIIGGNDTTRNSITGSVFALNQFRSEYEKLEADTSLIPAMVSETIRWQTPLMHMRRVATKDCKLGAKTIRKGDKVVMWYLSGNYDESVISDPGRFMIDRVNPRKHLSFGMGIHRCMGNRMGEMQLRVLWEELLSRCAFIEVLQPPTRVLSNFVRGYSAMPVKLHPR